MNTIDKMFAEYIKNKRVIFVGGSRILTGLKKAKQIESYDVVVKSGGSIFLNTKEYYEDYGNRCDILYVNVQFCRELRPVPCQAFKRKGVKWLCMKSPANYEITEYCKHINARSANVAYREMQKRVRSVTYGPAIFWDLLKCQPKELFLTGIDFFSSKKRRFEHDNYQEYLDGYLPDKIRKQGNRINKGKKEDGHNFIENAKLVYDMFQKHDNLKTEKFIYNLLIDILNGKVTQR